MPQVTVYPRMPIWDYWKPTPPTMANEQDLPEVQPMSLDVSNETDTSNQTIAQSENGALF